MSSSACMRSCCVGGNKPPARLPPMPSGFALAPPSLSMHGCHEGLRRRGSKCRVKCKINNVSSDLVQSCLHTILNIFALAASIDLQGRFMANTFADEGIGAYYSATSNSSCSSKGNYGQQQLISFGSSKFDDFDDAGANRRKTKRSAREHALVERKRRQKLSQLFLSLASNIPGLQKGEKKARIVGETTSYIRKLKQRVLLLEQQALKRRTQDQTMDSAQICHIFKDHGSFSSDGNSDGISSKNGALDIEVQFSDEDDDILVAVHCKKNDNIVPKLLLEMRKLHLTPSNTHVMPFGNYMDITVVAQKQQDAISMTREDMQKHLQWALQQCYMQSEN
ncbi:hypothetical protein Cgig2_027414 [Carnegiea gigantea]|uniref:BHLH domain-containing protein n=1 Tax=Carnegiea gigantea TaxID=171969 RepID=A0A9Q1JU81_9CARY|nr:hypothetical protein Cgig2_027414 [Carnegiea gigantea]